MSVINKALGRISRQQSQSQRDAAVALTSASISEPDVGLKTLRVGRSSLVLLVIVTLIWTVSYMTGVDRVLSVNGVTAAWTAPGSTIMQVSPVNLSAFNEIELHQMSSLATLSSLSAKPKELVVAPELEIIPINTINSPAGQATAGIASSGLRVSSVYQLAEAVEVRINDGRLSEAYDLLSQVKTGFLDPTIALIRGAKALHGNGMTQEAISLLEGQLNRVRSSVPLLGQLIILYNATENPKGLETTYLKLMKVDPANVIWWIALGGVYETHGQLTNALQMYTEALKFRTIQPDKFHSVRARIQAVKRKIKQQRTIIRASD